MWARGASSIASPRGSNISATSQVIDIFAALGGANLTQPNITCDGCHPVDAGYIEIAQTMAPIMLADAKVRAILEE